MRRALGIAIVIGVIVIGGVIAARMIHPARISPDGAVSKPAAPAKLAAQTPRAAVLQYLDALGRKDYQAAYEMLSNASRQAHSLAAFSRQVARGHASLDTAKAREGPEQEGRVVVTLPLLEDVAEAGFTTVREDNTWRVVYLNGAPWFPYPEPASGK